MYSKLRRFQEQKDAGSSSSRFWERVKFWKREKDRQTCLTNLRTWHRRLDMVVSGACREAEKRNAVSANHAGPSPLLRPLSQRLFTALSRCWTCKCGTGHTARFSLGSCKSTSHDLNQVGIAFDILICHSKCETGQAWREGTIVIKIAR